MLEKLCRAKGHRELSCATIRYLYVKGAPVKKAVKGSHAQQPSETFRARQRGLEFYIGGSSTKTEIYALKAFCVDLDFYTFFTSSNFLNEIYFENEKRASS